MERALYRRLAACVDASRPAVVVTVVSGPGFGCQQLFEADGTTVGDLGPAADALAEPVRAAVDDAHASFQPRRQVIETDDGPATLFIDVVPPRRSLIVVGGVHVAVPLVGFARTLGMRTVVVDPRTAFATRERFPDVDAMDHGWPDEALAAIGLDAGSYVVTLSHDDKLDVPALAAALRSPARYIGALGSRKTHAKRVAALTDLGFGAADLARIHNPIGLPLGGRGAPEIAVSVLAEMVAVDHGTRARFGGRG